jgi:NAD(P)-dependent dehydrogenase (short-subunit alcohol dehydrogenase family)
LTARDEKRGKKAAESLNDPSVSFAQLDVTSPSSIQSFADHIRSRHGEGGVAALVNNAGVAPAVAGDGGKFSSEIVDWVLDTNYDGLREVCLDRMGNGTGGSPLLAIHLLTPKGGVIPGLQSVPAPAQRQGEDCKPEQ